MNNNLLVILCIIMFPFGAFSQQNIEIVQQHLNNAVKKYNLSPTDVENWIITSQHISSTSGITHIYLRQTYQDIEVRTANASIHLNKNGEIISMSNHFVADLSSKINDNTDRISAISALEYVSQQLNYNTIESINVIQEGIGFEQAGILQATHISRRDIKTKLMYEPLEDGTFTLAWNMQIYEIDEANWWNMMIDATTGEILNKVNWIQSCDWGDDDHHNHAHEADASADRPTPLLPHAPYPVETNSSVANMMVGSYNVYPMPVESPNHGSRSLVSDPEDLVASPFGWHDTDGVAGAEFTITRGNNTHTYEDGDNDGYSPDGGAGLSFDYNINTTYSNGDQSENASLTNLFFWTNIMHDLWYRYGFDEASGNFQQNNYGNGGAGNDYVLAEGQDGSGTCNANFGTPDDGSNPTMQMYVCNSRDGSFDNGVIAHEYGHGISTRLTGGANNSDCLFNTEQMGEGWSDWLGMMMTIEADDAGTDSRGMGTWLFGQTVNGNGIRTYPYSTNMNINPHTYDDINTEAAPHGVGSVWCAMLWEMTWALIDEHGFDPDFYNGTGGNNIAMSLVIEGLKLQPCSPGFVDGRDAILLADQNINGGANQCLIWTAFAKRGLGFSADQGATSSKVDGTEAFDMPPPSINLTKTASVNETLVDGSITYTLKATNLSCTNAMTNVVISDDIPVYTTYTNGSASDGGTETGGTVTFPGVTLAPNTSITRTFSVTVDSDAPSSDIDFTDDMELGTSHWTTSANNNLSNWVQQAGTGVNESTAWFAQNVDSSNEQYLTFASNVTLTATSELSFTHSYDTEASWDGGLVEISSNNGVDWTDLGANMTDNGYNSTIDNNATSPAFSGNSRGFVTTTVDLSSYADQVVQIRFRMHCDQFVGGNGWYIDNVALGSFVKIPNIANVSTAEGFNTTAALVNPTCIIEAVSPVIQFEADLLNIDESSSSANVVASCLTFTDYTMNIIANVAPSTPAEVSVTLAGTADMEDFELLTSSITVNAAGIYPITVRVYDEGNIEDSENIELGLMITNSGATDATIGNNNTSIISIADNDKHPVSGTGVPTSVYATDLETDDGGLGESTVGSGNWSLGNGGSASSQYWDVPDNSSTQFIYINDDECDCDMSNIKLLIPSIDLSTATGATFAFDVFYENRTVQSGIRESAQIEVSIDGGTTYTPLQVLAGVLDVWRTETIDLSSYLGMSDVRLAVRYNDNGGWMYGIAVDNINITTENTSPVLIADEINDTDEQYVGANSDVYFYHADGSLMARIQNGNHNFGCVELTVDRAGTGATDFQDNVTANQLADKTFLFTPEFNNPSGTYVITLYYTQAEVAGWEAATGHTWTDAQIIKSPSSVTHITPANPEPEGSGTVQVNAATDAGNPSFADTDYFISTLFTNGFSGMGVGNPSNVLPIELLAFTGEHIPAKGNLIKWSIVEFDNDFFILERSFDGRTYEQIAKIEAAQLTTPPINYDFLDTKYQRGDNYYRLTQQDVNGQRTTTAAIILHVKEGASLVNIFPNPTQGVVHVTFEEPLNTKVQLTLYDALGRLVQNQTFDTNNFNFNMDELRNGVYHLSLNYNGTHVQQKIVKTAN